MQSKYIGFLMSLNKFITIKKKQTNKILSRKKENKLKIEKEKNYKK